MNQESSMRVAVASKNPIKIKATKLGFAKMFPEQRFDFEGVSVSSGVSDQPMNDEETFQGAFNRAEGAKVKLANADYWVGIEGGVEKVKQELEAFAWVVILSKSDTGRAKTSTFVLPKIISDHIHDGKELAHANDEVYKITNSKHGQGMVGSLTHGVIDRTQLYLQAVILALIPFRNEKLYK